MPVYLPALIADPGTKAGQRPRFRHEYALATVSDGVKIALAVGYPKGFDPADRGRRWPAIFTTCGYEFVAAPSDPAQYGDRYVTVNVSIRGTGASGGDPTKGKFPESFFVDYVRIYEYPHDSDPVVRLAKKPDESTYILKPGEELHFQAQVEPSAKTGAKIKRVYLFDSGALLDYRSAPPYDFVVRITQDYYEGTNFVKPGRAGIRPDWDRGLHAFCIFAQDERGNVGRSENVVKLLRKNGRTGPYLGKPLQLPGQIMLSHYDEGGQGFSHSLLGMGICHEDPTS